MKCAYCFGEIHGEPHVVRGRAYHPPRMDPGNRAFSGTGCANADKALEAAIYRTSPKVAEGQTRLC